jgi:hypothetical protein
MRRTAWIILAVCLLSAPLARAQTPPAPADTADAQALALIEDQSPGGDILGERRQRLISLIAQRWSATPAQATEAVDKIVMPEFKAELPQLEDRLVRVWTLRFTADELREIRASLRDGSPGGPERFANSQLGMKYLAEKDEIDRESDVAWREWGPPIAQEAFSRHVADLKAMGFDLSKIK